MLHARIIQITATEMNAEGLLEKKLNLFTDCMLLLTFPLCERSSDYRVSGGSHAMV